MRNKVKIKNIITPTQNGPLHFKGTYILVSSKGEKLEKSNELYLCRCGHSKNKPYCDGSHKKANYINDGLFINPPKTDEDIVEADEVVIKLQQNGPLMLTGNLCITEPNTSGVISDNSSKEIFLQKTVLCRCGESKNSPFCDGTHAKNNFIAD